MPEPSLRDTGPLGLIFDIQGYAVHDGPGCRTLVFLSGCPLRCAWCANPEGLLARPRLMYRARRCTPSRYRCVSACPRGAVHRREGDPVLSFDRSVCDSCETHECVGACLKEALTLAGRLYSVDQLMRVLRRDQGFWGADGGVTFGGGEPFLQRSFLSRMLRACHESLMHVAVETSAHVETDHLLGLLPWIDYLLIDIKHMDSAEHAQGTGAPNDLILRNIRAVTASGWKGRIVIRIPVVPGYNDGETNLRATAAFVREAGLSEVDLLPFHRLGQSKYEQLGMEYAYAGTEAPSPEALRAHRRLFEDQGIVCTIGSRPAEEV